MGEEPSYLERRYVGECQGGHSRHPWHWGKTIYTKHSPVNQTQSSEGKRPWGPEPQGQGSKRVLDAALTLGCQEAAHLKCRGGHRAPARQSPGGRHQTQPHPTQGHGGTPRGLAWVHQHKEAPAIERAQGAWESAGCRASPGCPGDCQHKGPPRAHGAAPAGSARSQRPHKGARVSPGSAYEPTPSGPYLLPFPWETRELEGRKPAPSLEVGRRGGRPKVNRCNTEPCAHRRAQVPTIARVRHARWGATWALQHRGRGDGFRGHRGARARGLALGALHE